jgi:hypothetical protein
MDARIDKLSATLPFNFRPGPTLAKKVRQLQAEVKRMGGKVELTEIIREGLLANWEHVRTHMLVRHTTAPANAELVTRIVAVANKAIQHGVTADEVESHLSDLLERKLPVLPV